MSQSWTFCPLRHLPGRRSVAVLISGLETEAGRQQVLCSESQRTGKEQDEDCCLSGYKPNSKCGLRGAPPGSAFSSTTREL